MCKNCPYWYDDSSMKPRCNYERDGGKYGKSACDAEYEDMRITQKEDTRK